MSTTVVGSKMQSFRLTPEDDRCIVHLQKKHNLGSRVGAIRHALQVACSEDITMYTQSLTPHPTEKGAIRAAVHCAVERAERDGPECSEERVLLWSGDTMVITVEPGMTVCKLVTPGWRLDNHFHCSTRVAKRFM